MDLDALSGIVAYRHTGESVTTVTAAVDRIVIKHPLKEICMFAHCRSGSLILMIQGDLELSGQVTFTGRSSMEIQMQVAKAPTEGEQVNSEDVLLTCAFTMVSPVN
jgi:acyl-coenzyme A thioesterase 9